MNSRPPPAPNDDWGSLKQFFKDCTVLIGAVYRLLARKQTDDSPYLKRTPIRKQWILATLALILPILIYSLDPDSLIGMYPFTDQPVNIPPWLQLTLASIDSLLSLIGTFLGWIGKPLLAILGIFIGIRVTHIAYKDTFVGAYNDIARQCAQIQRQVDAAVDRMQDIVRRVQQIEARSARLYAELETMNQIARKMSRTALPESGEDLPLEHEFRSQQAEMLKASPLQRDLMNSTIFELIKDPPLAETNTIDFPTTTLARFGYLAFCTFLAENQRHVHYCRAIHTQRGFLFEEPPETTALKQQAGIPGFIRIIIGDEPYPLTNNDTAYSRALELMYQHGLCTYYLPKNKLAAAPFKLDPEDPQLSGLWAEYGDTVLLFQWKLTDDRQTIATAAITIYAKNDPLITGTNGRNEDWKKLLTKARVGNRPPYDPSWPYRENRQLLNRPNFAKAAQVIAAWK